MRLMRVLVLALLAACASAPRGSVSLEGTYRLDRVNGRPLPAPSGDEDGVMLQEGALALQPDSSFTLRMVAVVRSGPPVTAEIAGAYRVNADSLALTPDADSPADESRFRWRVQDTFLHLHDEDGDEFIFVRQ